MEKTKNDIKDNQIDNAEKVEENTASVATETDSQESSNAPVSKKRKKGLSRKAVAAICIVCAVLIVAGAGFWVWHEQPSFCNAICHDPMDPYLPTYEAETGAPAVDKWGNEIGDGSEMLAAVHREEADSTCMTCHVPTLSEQVGEAFAWISGNYYVPLEERTLSDLTEARGVEKVEFCLNESCHDISRSELIELTANEYEFNPHSSQHGAQDCTICHKAHRESVMLCTECHSEAVVPEGWVSAAEGKKLAEAQGLKQKGLAGV